MPAKETITRRSLPHWYVPGASHFITYRLFNSLPKAVLEQLSELRESLLASPSRDRRASHKRLFAAFDSQLDQSGSKTWLADPRIAAMVRANLYHHHGAKYYLQAYCVMPNHVHVLFQPCESLADHSGEFGIGEQADARSPLAKIMHSLKSYAAHEANHILRRTGTFWQAESYDHWVRDEDELERIVAYIANNPVRAGLVKNPHEWFFSSSHDRYLMDGEVSGWLLWNA